jgi:hypothetical protein
MDKIHEGADQTDAGGVDGVAFAVCASTSARRATADKSADESTCLTAATMFG